MNKTCGECRSYFECESVFEDDAACAAFMPSATTTVFDHITASPGVLAPKFIYTVCTSDGEQRWCSALLEVGSWFSESEAINATVAKLKEVCNGNALVEREGRDEQ